VIFHDGRNQESVILRNAKGRPYQNPQIVGWMSDTQLVVMAFQGGERHAVAVEPSGRITQMVTLPENAVTMLAGDGAFWYVTAMPSDDIAFDVLGPSELHRVGVDGKDEMIARSEDVVIDHVTIGAEQRFAYLISGSLYVSDAGVPVDRGTGRPVGWLENGDLLVVARNSKLLAVPQGKDTRVDVMNDFPSGIGHVWSVTLESATSAR
jgi:archaeosine-15-forming tRNA-guanine transglycosylase